MTRQQISLVPPNVGNFVIQCISHQNEFYSTTAVVNLNVNSSDGSDGDNSTVSILLTADRNNNKLALVQSYQILIDKNSYFFIIKKMTVPVAAMSNVHSGKLFSHANLSFCA